MDFAEVLTSAWKIIWKHKILWIFGIFAGCSRGGGGGGSGGGGGNRVNTPGGPEVPFQTMMNQFGDWLSTHIWVVVLFVIVVILLVLLSILLGTMGRIGLIKGTAKADAGAEHLGFMELWDESRPYFWRIFLLSLLIFFAALIVFGTLIALGVGLAVFTLGLALICLIPLFCLLIPAFWALGIVVQQAEAAIVLENLGVMDGLRRGWDVFRQNLGPMLIMWLILGVLGFVIGLVVVLPILAIVVPAAIAYGVTGGEAARASVAPLVVAGLCFVAYLPVLIVLNGILMAYLQSAWTLTYLRLTNKPKDNTVIESPVVPAPNA